ncbi:MAG: phosphatase PAP2 family protein [Leptothrix sp. (in: b-proteobacteria)]
MAPPRPRPRALKPHQRSRRLWLALTLASLALFLAWPELDLHLSGALRRVGGPDAPAFAWGEWPLVKGVYQLVPWLARLAVLACLGLIALPRLRALRGSRQHGLAASGAQHPARPVLTRWCARAPLVLAVLVIGLWWVVNSGFKDHWGRPRPVQVTELGGTLTFRSIAGRFDHHAPPSTLCELNCSFPTGHGATGFVLMAAGLRAAADRRRRWGLAGLAAGAFIGLGRMLQGGHYASDVLFAGLMIWGVCLLVQRAAVRLRARSMRAAQRA